MFAAPRLSAALRPALLASIVLTLHPGWGLAAAMRMGPAAHGANGLGALWNRGSTWTAVQLPAATKTPAAKRGFAAKLQSHRGAAPRPGWMRAEAARAALRLAALRATPARGRDEIARLAPEQRDAYRTLVESSPDLQVSWDGDRVVFLSGFDLGGAHVRGAAGIVGAGGATAAAARALAAAAPLFQVRDAASELHLERVQEDAFGQTHLRYQQVYRGFEIWGRELIAHVNPDGRVSGLNGRLEPTPSGLAGATASLDAAAAERRAGANDPHAAARAEQLQIYVLPSGTARLAWRVLVSSGLADRRDLFVDATNGEVLHSVSRVATDGATTGSGVDLLGQARNLDLYLASGTYYQVNAAKPMWDDAASSAPQKIKGGIRIFDAQHGEADLYFSASSSPSLWTGKAADVSAAANASIVYDYYNTRHARNSIDGQGGNMELVVNFKTGFDNAFWNGQFMIFGNGDGSRFSDLAGALDVTAHEMTHGVVEHTAGLLYETQSGALNESFADVFGTCAEFFAHPGSANFLLGEDVTTPGIPGDALRNMQDPGAANVAFGGQQPGKMSQYQTLLVDQAHDNGGVHVNSGIPNHAFYLLATNPALGATPTDRIGKAESIYYRALSSYLTRSAQFVDCRLAVVHAAEDLFGAGGPVAAACAAAFDQVEIGNGAPSNPPPTLPPVLGSEHIAATFDSSGYLVRLRPDGSRDPQFPAISSVPIHNKPSFTDDGAVAIYIDSSRRLRAARSDGGNEQVLSNEPIWGSIAVSPDGNWLAATANAPDGKIYLLDLLNGTDNREYPIHAQNYGGEGDRTAQFADFLDFSNDGQYVLYDAYNLAVQASGDTLGSWDINLLRRADGGILRVFPPQEPGIDIGNPTFSPTQDFVIAFDYVDSSGRALVLGADLDRAQLELITANGTTPGRPSFSPDAKHVVFHFADETGRPSLWTVSLAENGIKGNGDETRIVEDFFDPIWFAIGHRTAVTLSSFAATLEGGEARLEWESNRNAGEVFFVLRDTGAGFEPRSGALRQPESGTGGRERWLFRDALGDLPAGVERLRYAVATPDGDGAPRILATVLLTLGAAPRRAVILQPNSPNPFNPSTAIAFTLGRPQRSTTLAVFDAAGRRVRTLWQGAAPAGAQVRFWDGRDDAGRPQPSGIYVARLVTPDGNRAHKMTLLR